MASACLTLGLVHLYVWHKQRSQYSSLLFFVLAVSVAACAAFELSLMRAQTPEAYATALRWGHVPLSLVILSIVGFVYFYFNAGRVWLAIAVCVFRLLALVANFTTGVNINFKNISALNHAVMWGGSVVSVAVGVLNPWWILAQIGNVLLVTFIVDASITLWRRGDALSRHRAMVVGGSLTLCCAFAIVLSSLSFTARVRAPTDVTPAFFIVVLAMGYELSQDVVRAAQLSRDLRESERRTELAAQGARLAFWSWDAESRDFWTNALGRSLFGFAAAERIVLDAVLARVHPDDRLTLRRAIEETARGGGTFEQEFRILTPGSAIRWLAARGQVDGRSAGTPTLLRGVAFDISARVHMEQQLGEHRRELAHISRVSTLSALAASLAHELNQPLMSILANAEAAQSFLERTNAGSREMSEMLADIVEADKGAGEVIHRLRELLRKGQVQFGPLNVNNVIEDVLRLTRSELSHRGVVASAELTPALPPVQGDRIQIQQVLLNLVMNACEAMDGPRKVRKVHLCTRADHEKEVEISITDSGSGVPTADLERIFEPFMTTKEHGMGLGLSVCRTIVAAHGGRLWAENNADAGATFRLTLPCAVTSS